MSLGSTGREEPPEFDFLGLGCDPAVSKQPEAKNLSKRVKRLQKRTFLTGFLHLAPLKQHGCTPNQKNQVLGVLPNL